VTRTGIRATEAAAETEGVRAVRATEAARAPKGTPSTESENEKVASPVAGAIPTGIGSRAGASVKERNAVPEGGGAEDADTAPAAPVEEAAPAGAPTRARAFPGGSS